MNKEFEEWIKTRPVSVQLLIAEFPPFTTIDIDGELHYLLGWTENDSLIISTIDPVKDYDKAQDNKRYICAEHVRQKEQ